MKERKTSEPPHVRANGPHIFFPPAFLISLHAHALSLFLRSEIKKGERVDFFERGINSRHHDCPASLPYFPPALCPFFSRGPHRNCRRQRVERAAAATGLLLLYDRRVIRKENWRGERGWSRDEEKGCVERREGGYCWPGDWPF